MNPVTSAALALCVAMICLPARLAVADEPRQLDAHEHGAARLNVVLDDHDLVIALETPAANVLGFEHRPRDEAEREAMGSAFARLRDGTSLFALVAEAGCRQSSATIESALAAGVGDDEHHEDEHHKDEHHEGEHHEGEHHEGEHHEGEHHEGEHADIDATWMFHCDAPVALESIGVRLFEHFGGFAAIDVQFVGPVGQAAVTLTPDASTMTW